MREYRLFGGKLRSAMELPDLPATAPGARSDVDWTLEVARGPLPEPSGAPLGEDRVTAHARVRLYREADGEGYVLAFDDTGVFRLSADGGRITWTPAESAAVLDARLDLLGRVLPFALHLRGLLVLHASAVVVGEGAVALVGPKGHGKSTLAHALVSRGAVLLTDDALPVFPLDVPAVLPGVRRLRLRPDAAATLPGLNRSTIRRAGRTEVGFDGDDGLREELPVPLARVYLLDPRPPGEGGPIAASEELQGPEAAAGLLSQAKLAPLLAPWSAGDLLRQASAVARAVSVRRLTYSRDLSRLDEIAGLVLGGGEAAGAPPAVAADAVR